VAAAGMQMLDSGIEKSCNLLQQAMLSSCLEQSAIFDHAHTTNLKIENIRIPKESP
jgi:hypothetical protein